MQLPLYKATIDPMITSDLEVNFIGLVEKPAIEKNFQAFDEAKLKFAIDAERRIVSGPAMIAGMQIYRNDPVLGEYNVEFDKQSIFNIVNKFAAKGYMQKVNLFHDPSQQQSGITFFNSFITDAQMGIKPPAGYEDVADGSWFLSCYFDLTAETAWQDVKGGKVNGFSVEGLFTYIPVKMAKMSEEQAIELIKKILNETSIQN